MPARSSHCSAVKSSELGSPTWDLAPKAVLSCHVLLCPRARWPSQEQREWGKWRSLLVPTVSQERRGDRSVPIEVRCGVNTPGQLVGNCCLPATGVVSLPLSPSVSPPCKPDKSLWRHSKNSEPLSRSHTHTVRSYSRERLSTIVPGDPYESLEAELPDLLLPPLPPCLSSYIPLSSFFLFTASAETLLLCGNCISL